VTGTGGPGPSVGFIGLGIMGSPMAANLCAAGLRVVGYTRTRARAEALAGFGLRVGDDIAGTVEGADVVITMLPDSPDVQDVMLGPAGVLGSAKPGAVLIDMSTIKPDVARAVAAEAASRGLRFLDAPVSGGEQGAIDAQLSIMVGGDANTVAEVMPVLERLGTRVVHVGSVGAGQTVKAANQLIVAGTLELVAESLVFLQAHHVDTDAAISVLEAGLAGSTVLSRKARSMIAGQFAPGFRIALHDKDLGIFTSAAREVGSASPIGALVAQLMASAHAQGDGDLDHSALLRLVRRLSGIGEP